MWRWIGIGAGICAGLIALTAGALVVFSDRLGDWVIEREVRPALEQRFGVDLDLGAAEIGFGRASFEGVEIRGARSGDRFASIDRVRVEFGILGALRGRPEIGLVALEGARAELSRGGGDGDGGDVQELLAGVRGGGAASASGGDGEGRELALPRIELRGGSLELRDEERGIVFAAGDAAADVGAGEDARVRLREVEARAEAGPTAKAAELDIEAEPEEIFGSARAHMRGGRIALREGLELSGVRGEVAAREPWAIALDLEGSYGGADEPLWAATGELDLRDVTGELFVDAERFTLDRIAHVLADAPIRRHEEATLGASLRVRIGPEVASFRGDVDIAGVTVAHPMIAPRPVEDLAATGSVRGEIDRLARGISVDEATLEVEGVEYDLEGYLWLPGGVDPLDAREREAARGGGRIAVGPVACGAVLASIPEALTPDIEEFELTGEFEASVRADVDLENPRATDLEGSIDLGGCGVERAPPRMRAARLSRPFAYRAQLAEGEEKRVSIGPDNPDFVPLDDVSPHLVNSLMTTEDSNFFGHDGFVRGQFEEALTRNLERGYFRYGASSITMQMVKNVLLGHEKTLSRKLQELFLTWYVERALSKDRIMEIYVNAIEFGPGIYGIGQASEHYFGKDASELGPVEAAFFSSILPNPRGRYGQFCRGELRAPTENMIERIIDLMYERDRLSSIEHQIATSTPLIFDRSAIESEGRCIRRARRALDNLPARTPPLEGDLDPGEVATR